MRAHTGRFLLTLLIGFLLVPSRSEGVTIDWVTVGEPGNAADTEVMNDNTTGYGAVSYVYRISKYEVTNAQYAEFLNAIAVDLNDLYNPQMSSSPHGGISQSGSPGSFSYTVKPGFELRPVNFVSFTDAAYFTNWLNNGQPAQSSPDPLYAIRDGAYDVYLDPVGTTRNPDATIFVPSEDEWYKAAYYDPQTDSYRDFPAGSDFGTACSLPTGAANSANCSSGPGGGPVPDTPTAVGSYPGSPSPHGTFDQGGNVHEWNETMVHGSSRGLRGGFFAGGYGWLAAPTRDWSDSSGEIAEIGFRVAAVVPEPGTGALVIAGLLGLAGVRRNGS
jgi:formylglycine-generating enzyme required for sulfatase activity